MNNLDNDIAIQKIKEILMLLAEKHNELANEVGHAAFHLITEAIIIFIDTSFKSFLSASITNKKRCAKMIEYIAERLIDSLHDIDNNAPDNNQETRH